MSSSQDDANPNITVTPIKPAPTTAPSANPAPVAGPQSPGPAAPGAGTTPPAPSANSSNAPAPAPLKQWNKKADILYTKPEDMDPHPLIKMMQEALNMVLEELYGEHPDKQQQKQKSPAAPQAATPQAVAPQAVAPQAVAPQAADPQAQQPASAQQAQNSGQAAAIEDTIVMEALPDTPDNSAMGVNIVKPEDDSPASAPNSEQPAPEDPPRPN